MSVITSELFKLGFSISYSEVTVIFQEFLQVSGIVETPACK